MENVTSTPNYSLKFHTIISNFLFCDKAKQYRILHLVFLLRSFSGLPKVWFP